MNLELIWKQNICTCKHAYLVLKDNNLFLNSVIWIMIQLGTWDQEAWWPVVSVMCFFEMTIYLFATYQWFADALPV